MITKISDEKYERTTETFYDKLTSRVDEIKFNVDYVDDYFNDTVFSTLLSNYLYFLVEYYYGSILEEISNNCSNCNLLEFVDKIDERIREKIRYEIGEIAYFICYELLDGYVSIPEDIPEDDFNLYEEVFDRTMSIANKIIKRTVDRHYIVFYQKELLF